MNTPEFQTHAENHFHFLIERHGFAQTTAQPNIIRYSSTDVVVEVNYSGRGEVDVIMDENPSSYRFQLRLFLMAFYPAVEKALGYAIANSDDEVNRELKRFSYVLQEYGKPLLERDRQVFEKMRIFKW